MPVLTLLWLLRLHYRERETESGQQERGTNMGLFAYTIAGGGFMLVGAWESFISSIGTQNIASSTAAITTTTTQPSSQRTKKKRPSSSSITWVAISLLSFSFISNSLISLIDALNSKDRTGLVLQLEVIAIASLFFLCSLLGFITHLTNSITFPSPILNLLCLFGFVEEFLLFYLQRKDPSGIENRYFDLLLVPIGVCVVSTILELRTLKTRFSRLARGIGLILQGTWFVQMGFSFFSGAIAHGCFLREKSRGNYTIKCKGHPEYHRGRAIATLQFNCHLALMVVLVVGVYSVVCKRIGIGGEFTRYRPIGAEMQQLDSHAPRFTLDSDDDDNEDGIKEVGKPVIVVPESAGINGHGSR